MSILLVRALIVCFQIFNLVSSQVNECSDPNAELRSDHPDCVLTCNKRSIQENSAFCFQNHTLINNCYCKQGYYLEETTKKCISFQDCPCNTANNELSRFSNECGNNCKTFHTPNGCSNLLHSQCWCHLEYCKDADGTCILKSSIN